MEYGYYEIWSPINNWGESEYMGSRVLTGREADQYVRMGYYIHRRS